MMVKNRKAWGVTVELSLRYKKPIPLDEALRVVGRVTRDTSRIFEGAGEILLKSGEVAVSAVGKYMKMPIDKITEFKELEWQVTPLDSDPRELEV
jgi:acyl-CoA thioesterase FadM